MENYQISKKNQSDLQIERTILLRIINFFIIWPLIFTKEDVSRNFIGPNAFNEITERLETGIVCSI